MKYLIHPKAIFPLRLFRSGGTQEYCLRDFRLLFFSISQFLLLTTFVVSLAGADLLTSVATALATLGNIGPGFGLVGPTDNYSHFPDAVKWVLSFCHAGPGAWNFTRFWCCLHRCSGAADQRQ